MPYLDLESHEYAPAPTQPGEPSPDARYMARTIVLLPVICGVMIALLR